MGAPNTRKVVKKKCDYLRQITRYLQIGTITTHSSMKDEQEVVRAVSNGDIALSDLE